MRTWIISILFWFQFLTQATPNGTFNVQHKETDESHIAAIASILADTNKSPHQRFEQILTHALQLEDYARGGPDTLFSKYPNWPRYLRIYTDESEATTTLIPEYKNADLSFLSRWVARNGPKRITNYLTELGYIPKQGLPKKRRISPNHQRLILEFALEIYISSTPAT